VGILAVEIETQPTAGASEANGAAFSERFADSLGYTARVHAGQIKRADGRPYIAHLLRVAGLVIQEGGSEDEAIAALLHDAAEDHGGFARLDEIRTRYGRTVADLVEECTDSLEEPKPPWRRQKEQHLAEFERCCPGALLVLLADKLDNARTMLREHRVHGEELWKRYGKGPGDVRWYYGALSERLPALRPGALADELTRTCSELDRQISGELGAPSA
jgi:(p)ppGpp synthase/HD superfamily hydrolase